MLKVWIVNLLVMPHLFLFVTIEIVGKSLLKHLKVVGNEKLRGVKRLAPGRR